jgi:hypothetical protein
VAQKSEKLVLALSGSAAVRTIQRIALFCIIQETEPTLLALLLHLIRALRNSTLLRPRSWYTWPGPYCRSNSNWLSCRHRTLRPDTNCCLAWLDRTLLETPLSDALPADHHSIDGIKSELSRWSELAALLAFYFDCVW